MIEDISGVTPKLVVSALDALLLKHEVTAHNIANVSTKNYSAQRVSFDQYVANFSLSASNSSEKEALTAEISSINEMLSNKTDLIYSTGEDVQIDKEVIQLTETVLKYRALLEANSKRSEIIGMAVRGRGGQ